MKQTDRAILFRFSMQLFLPLRKKHQIKFGSYRWTEHSCLWSVFLRFTQQEIIGFFTLWNVKIPLRLFAISNLGSSTQSFPPSWIEKKWLTLLGKDFSRHRGKISKQIIRCKHDRIIDFFTLWNIVWWWKNLSQYEVLAGQVGLSFCSKFEAL